MHQLTDRLAGALAALVVASGIVLGIVAAASDPLPTPFTADCNGDGVVDLSDAIFLLGYLFQGGPAPADLIAQEAREKTFEDQLAYARSLLETAHGRHALASARWIAARCCALSMRSFG